MDEKVHQLGVFPQRIAVSTERFVRETEPGEIEQTDIMVCRQIEREGMKIITTVFDDDTCGSH
jgi:hypothetical protein